MDENEYAQKVIDLLTRRRTTVGETMETLGISLDEMVYINNLHKYIRAQKRICSAYEITVCAFVQVCMRSEKFVGYAVALVGVSVTSIAVLAVVFVRRKQILAWVYGGGKNGGSV